MESPEISEFLQERIGAGDFPSAVYMAAQRGEAVFEGAVGNAVIEPEVIKARIDTIYDLASITKVLVTALVCAKLLERQEIGLNDPVARYLSEFRAGEKKEITIQDLLTHTSGLPAWRPFYLERPRDRDVEIRSRLISLIAALPLEYKKNSAVRYSDPNFILLTLLVEKICGRRLDEIAVDEISGPLGLTDTVFNPSHNLRPRIAASERGNEFEKQTSREYGYDVSGYDWRDRVIWGEVHDGNAWAMEGVSGHAGLFSTAREVLVVAQQFLPAYTQILAPRTCALFRENLTPGLNEARSFAFQLAAASDAAGDHLPPDAFGHLGFTGTSLWIDPGSERVYILLTNRTHNRELPFQNLNAVRREYHDRAAKILDKKT